jgi:hypothetical protein
MGPLTGGEWSASRPCRFSPRTHEVGWAPEPVWTTWRRENSWPYWDSNSDPLIVQFVARRYTDDAIQAPKYLYLLSLKIILISSSYLQVDLPSWIFSSGFPAKMLYASLFFLVWCPPYLTLLHLGRRVQTVKTSPYAVFRSILLLAPTYIQTSPPSSPDSLCKLHYSSGK